jgi:formylglycine-generating enzyme required for sulfatase activity
MFLLCGCWGGAGDVAEDITEGEASTVPLQGMGETTGVAVNNARKGKDYALFFAVDDYASNDNFANLPDPIVSAQKLARELREMYGFEAEIVRNPSKDEVYAKLQTYRQRSFGKDDQLLVFFSGHGDFDDFEVKGYFIPHAGPRIDLPTLGNIVTKIPCEHILLAIDACYSGTIDNRIAFKGKFSRPGVTLASERSRLVERKLRNPSRLLLTSGAKQRTPSGNDGSPFAKGFLRTLRSAYGSSDGLVTYEDLLAKLERVSPLPHHGQLMGHEEGSFVFVAKIAAEPVPVPSPRQEPVLSPKPVRTNPIPPPPENMVFIKGGTFQMGDQFGEGGSDEKPMHAVTVSDFYLSRTELTFAEYDRFCKATGRDLPEDEGWGRDQLPAINVSWLDAVAYCNWWSEQSGYTSAYQVSGSNVRANWKANGYRLPTEAEWEYAARSGGKKVKWAGTSTESSLSQFANHYGKEDGYERTSPVGVLRANNLGLADMTGNVWEWCWDRHDGDYYGKSPVRNPRGPDSGTARVFRGGSWGSIPGYCRAAFRSGSEPTGRINSVGFRLARSL